MVLSDIRLALALTYVGLLLWRSRLAGGLPDDWWLYLLVFGALNFGLYIAGEISAWWYGRRVVQFMRSLSADARDRWARRFQSSSAYRRLLLATIDEGSTSEHSGVISYPFAAGAVKAATAAFWASVAGGIGVLSGLILAGSRISERIGWGAIGVAFAFAAIASLSRFRLRYMDSRVEVSEFAIALIRDGERKGLRWTEPLLIRARPLLRPVELVSAATGILIPLDFERVGIDHLLGLVLERGGFKLPQVPSNEEL